MAQTFSTIGCQQALLHPNAELAAVLDYLCGQANKVFNCSAYYIRQVWFKERRLVSHGELCQQMKLTIHFRAMYASRQWSLVGIQDKSRMPIWGKRATKTLSRFPPPVSKLVSNSCVNNMGSSLWRPKKHTVLKPVFWMETAYGPPRQI